MRKPVCRGGGGVEADTPAILGYTRDVYLDEAEPLLSWDTHVMSLSTYGLVRHPLAQRSGIWMWRT